MLKTYLSYFLLSPPDLFFPWCPISTSRKINSGISLIACHSTRSSNYIQATTVMASSTKGALHGSNPALQMNLSLSLESTPGRRVSHTGSVGVCRGLTMRGCSGKHWACCTPCISGLSAGLVAGLVHNAARITLTQQKHVGQAVQIIMIPGSLSIWLNMSAGINTKLVCAASPRWETILCFSGKVSVSLPLSHTHVQTYTQARVWTE